MCTDNSLIEFIEMADLFASKCTKQEEKYDYYRRNGIGWRWQDCQAAYELLRERGDYWELRAEWTRAGRDVH